MDISIQTKAARGHIALALHAALGTSLVCWSLACLAQSENHEPSGLRFSGFGTLGLVHADAPEGWSYRRDISQVGSSRSTRADVDSRFGLQLNYTATPQIELVGQLITTRRSPYADRLDSIEWAFAAFRPSPEWTLRAGRLNLDQYLLSDFRNVGFAYDTVRPPVDFYGSIPNRLDGVDVARTWETGGARWRIKAYLGRSHFGDLDFDGITLAKSVYGLMVSRETDGLLVRAGVSRINIGNLPHVAQPLYAALSSIVALPIPSVAADATLLRDRVNYAQTSATYASVAASYGWNQWQFTAEAAHASGHPIASFNAAYVSVARRFGPVTGFGSVSQLRNAGSHVAVPNWAATLAPVLGSAAALQAQYLASAAADGINNAVADQQTLSLGARWDIHPQLALKLQWDHVVVGDYGGRLWAKPTASSARANVTSATLDFIF